MRTLLVDGEWNLKRNFKKRTDQFTLNYEHCGGVYGFLETLGTTINKILPDRVIVCWDGERSGKLRHDIYPLYKANHKEWDAVAYEKTEEEFDAQLKNKISISNQKIQTKNLLDGLFIRQSEVDLIEGDDLIALYVLKKENDEQVIIFSRDSDYNQLITDDVYILNPDSHLIITPKNFKQQYGYTHLNALLLKCIKGDDSDKVAGVPGVALKTILNLFPKFADEVYDINRLIDEASELYNKKKQKKLENIIGSRSIVKRNTILMDLKNPLVNEEAIQEIDVIRECVMAKENGQVDRSVTDVMSTALREGYNRFMYRGDMQNFFLPYMRIAAKEREYTKRILQG